MGDITFNRWLLDDDRAEIFKRPLVVTDTPSVVYPALQCFNGIGLRCRNRSGEDVLDSLVLGCTGSVGFGELPAPLGVSRSDQPRKLCLRLCQIAAFGRNCGSGNFAAITGQHLIHLQHPIRQANRTLDREASDFVGRDPRPTFKCKAAPLLWQPDTDLVMEPVWLAGRDRNPRPCCFRPVRRKIDQPSYLGQLALRTPVLGLPGRSADEPSFYSDRGSFGIRCHRQPVNLSFAQFGCHDLMEQILLFFRA